MLKNYLTDIPGIRVGHTQNDEALTGTTVILCEAGATAGVDVRGGAPGTRETDLLKSENLVEKVHAIVLSGGSAFGLDSASGVVHFLDEKNIGLDVGVCKVPIVPAAVIYDLEMGDYKVRPDFNMGYQACINASSGECSRGSVGAGIGASIGKILGPDYCMKGGLGSYTLQCGELLVSALVVVNAAGDVFNFETGEMLAGVYDRKSKKLLSTMDILKNKYDFKELGGKNTTIGVIATNAKLSKSQANKVAQMAHDAYGKSINPVHTMNDGDTIFVISTGEIESNVTVVGSIAVEAMARGISDAVMSATSVNDVVCYSDIQA